MTPQPYDAERALLELSVPEDVAARHLARLAAVRPSAPVVPLRPRRRVVRGTVAGLVLGATLASGAGVAAASTAAPGDALYGLKTARERLQLTMARPGDSRARLELKLARTRLGEAAALFRSGDTRLAIVTLARADAALASAGAHGGDDIDAEVAGELDRRVEVLGGLLAGGLPENASDAAREALERAIARGGRARTPGDAPGRSGDAPGQVDKPSKPVGTPTDGPGKSSDKKGGKPSSPPGRSDGHPSGPPSSLPTPASVPGR